MKEDTQTYSLVTEALRMALTSLEAKRNLYQLIIQNKVDFPEFLRYDTPTTWQKELKSCQEWVRTKNVVYNYWNW